MVYWGVARLIKERNHFKLGHLKFVHNLMEGMVIVKRNFSSTKLVNVAARKLLNLPFDSAEDTSEFFKGVTLYPIELVEADTQSKEAIHKSTSIMTFQ